MVRSVHVHTAVERIMARGRRVPRLRAGSIRTVVGCWALLLPALMVGCQRAEPVVAVRTHGLVGEAEAVAGRRAAAGLEERFGGTVADGAAVERMQAVERRLARGTPELRTEWQFHILASDRINAFSLPGGLIYVTRGLYERRIGEDNDMLAAVIAHEMAHVMRKDSLRPACGTTAEGLEREIAADRGAVEYLRAGGYGQRCMRDLLKVIEDASPEGWAEKRIRAIMG